jgi:lipopolysaccharide export system permease protein
MRPRHTPPLERITGERVSGASAPEKPLGVSAPAAKGSAAASAAARAGASAIGATAGAAKDLAAKAAKGLGESRVWRRTAAEFPGLSRMTLRLRLTRIERYVLTQTLLGVGGALAVLVALLTLIDFVELSRTVGVQAKDATVMDIFGLTLLKAPADILQIFPFAFLFGVLAAFVNLNRRSELVALRAAGVSAWRFIFPAGGAAVVIGVATILILNPIASALSDVFNRVESQMVDGDTAQHNKALWLRQGDRHTQVIIRAGTQLGNGVQLRDVVLFVYKIDADGAFQFSRRIEADQARLVDHQWVLSGVKEANPGAQATQVDEVTLPSTLNQRTALERFSSPQAVPFWSLPGMIARTERAGFTATPYRLQFDQLLATPLMFAAMSVLAAAFSLRLLRLGGLAQLAGSGVALGFVLYFMGQFFNSLGKAEIIPPFMAAWLPPLLALLAGFTALCYTEDG